MEMIQDLQGDPALQEPLAALKRDLNFANKLKPSSGIQFTLSDVGVALATADKHAIFKASPSRIQVNSKGFLEAKPDASSNTFYFERVDRESFATLLENFLNN